MKLFCVSLAATFALSAQSPSFEVASIKPNRSGEMSSSIRRGVGQITMTGVSLRKLTLFSYGIPDDREYALVGPDWLGTDRYDVLAKYPADTTQEQLRAMLQNMLAERFRLALHRETRQLPTYVLVVAKGGPKIKQSSGSPRTGGRPGHLDAVNIPTQHLADLFARYIGRPVRDETGLTGAYTFQLDWTPDETTRFGPDDASSATPGGASLFAALQDQLGLKLEGRKGPVEVLVVDHIERTPAEN